MHHHLDADASAPPRPEPGPLAAWWRDLVRSWRHTLTHARQPAIDEATLRDLGVARSELDSFRAEAEGLASSTRLRVACNAYGRP